MGFRTESCCASSPNFDQPPPVLRCVAVYGNPDKSKLPLKETEPYAGLSPYAKSKWDMEVMSPRGDSWFLLWILDLRVLGPSFHILKILTPD